MAKNIKLIIGSTRQNRVGKQVADWLIDEANKEGFEIEILDLKQVSLPNFDAPVSPAYMPTETEDGKKWQVMIEEADAFVFVTPEYNRSIPGSLKNAIDYLFKEWNEKPASIVSYGYVDGGLSATRHLIDILNWIKVSVVGEEIAIKFNRETFDESGRFRDIEKSLGDYREVFIASLKAIEHYREPATVK